MDSLFEIQDRILRSLNTNYERTALGQIPFDERAIMLLGARGLGKTTLFLQHLKKNFKHEALYISLDDIYFQEHSLYETAILFSQNKGEIILMDEVHKYPNWSIEVKNIYDLIPNMKMLITGSSILELEKSKADLSRRILNFDLPELSFREFLGIQHKLNLKNYPLDDIIAHHREIAESLLKEIDKPLFYFKQYLGWGAYPFFKETKYMHQRLKQTINLIIDFDLPHILPMEQHSLGLLKRLLYIIAQSVPYTPNVNKLSATLGCTRNTLYNMLKILQSAKLIYGLYHSSDDIHGLAKPEKIFLHNTNLMYALSERIPELGTIRETFFINMLESARHTVNYTKAGDFLINNSKIFEIGGRNKTAKQLEGLKNSYLVKDDIETGYERTIPLWLFGFLY